jgi:hypothetical protein
MVSIYWKFQAALSVGGLNMKYQKPHSQCSCFVSRLLIIALNFQHPQAYYRQS